MYTESTNEWQFIASPLTETPRLQLLWPKPCVHPVCVDDQLYAVTSVRRDEIETEIYCYDPNKDEWDHRTTRMDCDSFSGRLVACSMRVFKGSKFLREVYTRGESSSPLQSSTNPSSESSIVPVNFVKRKCAIM